MAADWSEDKFLTTRVVVTGLLCCVGVFLLAWSAYKLLNVLLPLGGHPLDKALAAFGEPSMVAHDVDEDFGTSRGKGPLYIGQRWTCYAAKQQAMIQPIADIVWVYGEDIRIKNGHEYQLRVWTRNGKGYGLPMSRSERESSLKELSEKSPWLYFGYNKQLKESWNQDRDDFIISMDERRRRVPMNRC
jgi:hypothetical protein